MIERLTFDTDKGNGVLIASVTKECEENHSLTCDTVCHDHSKKSGNSCKECPIQTAYDRLAAYERTNLSPSDITALQAENKRLEQQAAATRPMYDELLENRNEWIRLHAKATEENRQLKAELSDLRGQIERGEMVRVPCKVGDTVWVISNCDGVRRSLDGTMYSSDGSPGTATGYYCAYDGREDECPLAAGRDECDEEGFAVFEDAVSHISVQIGDEYEEPSIYIGLSHVSNYKDDKIYNTQAEAAAALKP